MKGLKDLGESGVIEILRRRIGTSGLSLNFQDDVGVIPLSDEESLVVSVDHLSEDVHFRRSTISAGDLGYKSLAVNLSDLAGKGATAVGCLLSWALPADLPAAWVEEFASGFGELAKVVPCALLGGDTGRSRDKIFISVTVIGIERMAHLKLRSAAREGDIIAVTGTLGNSAAGLDMLEGRIKKENNFLIRKHLQPTPRMLEGQWLSRQYAVHAMMDLSDGLALDLPRLLEAAGRSAWVDVSQIPYSEDLTALARHEKENPARWGIYGGEDYELLCTVRPADFPVIAANFKKQFNLGLTAIGEVTVKKEKPIDWKTDFDLSSYRSFEHFF